MPLSRLRNRSVLGKIPPNKENRKEALLENENRCIIYWGLQAKVMKKH